MKLAKIENGLVTQIIVCNDVNWANDRLGGTWIACDNAVGIGFSYSDENGFEPPIQEESPYDDI